MTIDRLINVLVTVMLIEMMVAIGLGVTIAELMVAVRNWRLMGLAALANYVLVPAATVGLLVLFPPADSTASAGFLILAVCPGAPFGPPCTAIAKGNTSAAVGLMMVLAVTSALAAPLLLHLLLPLLSDSAELEVDGLKLLGTLLVTQLVPLFIGLGVRYCRPHLADRLQKPANRISAILSLVTVGVILGTQYPLLAEIRFSAYARMLSLFVATLFAGWVCGGPGSANRRAMMLTTALRNVGVGLVIATSNFAGTAAVLAVMAYGVLEIFGSLLLAMAWGTVLNKLSNHAVPNQP